MFFRDSTPALRFALPFTAFLFVGTLHGNILAGESVDEEVREASLETSASAAGATDHPAGTADAEAGEEHTDARPNKDGAHAGSDLEALAEGLRLALLYDEYGTLRSLCPDVAEAAAQQPSGRDAALWSAREAECWDAISEQSRALAAWRRVLAEDPSVRPAVRARTRIRVLERRVDGELASPVHQGLDQVRRQRLQLGSDVSIERVTALIPLATTAFERAEIYLWLGDEFLDLRRDYDASRAWYLQVLDLEGLEPRVYYQALNRIVDIGLYSGELREPARDVDRFIRLHPEIADAADLHSLRAWAAPMAWRHATFAASTIGLTLLLLLALYSRFWAVLMAPQRYGWRPWTKVALLAWLFLGAGVMAEMWDHGFFAPFGLAFVFVALVHLVGTSSTASLLQGGQPRWLLGVAGLVVGWATAGAIYMAVHLTHLHAILGL